MRVQSTTPAMVMGCKSYTAKNGVTYFSCDVYDLSSNEMYACELNQEDFNKLMNVQKPASVKGLILDIGKPFQGRSRLQLVGWQ